MGIGASILLIAVGAILTFAVHWHLAGLDLNAVGWILMTVGVLGLVLFFVFWNNRQRPTTVVTDSRPVTDRRVVAQPRAVITEPRTVTERRVVTEQPAVEYSVPPPPPPPSA